MSCAHAGCDLDDVLRCSRCRSVGYCSKGHQKADWRGHKSFCGKEEDGDADEASAESTTADVEEVLLRRGNRKVANHDLEGAQNCLPKCESVMNSDYFFSFRSDPTSGRNEFIAEFITSARKLIFKKFCLIHQKIDMVHLARQLHMPAEEAEKWMVDLIRNNTLQMDNAKIDSAQHMAIMDMQYPSIYERIIEKTQDLTVRSYELANNLQRARYRQT